MAVLPQPPNEEDYQRLAEELIETRETLERVRRECEVYKLKSVRSEAVVTATTAELQNARTTLRLLRSLLKGAQGAIEIGVPSLNDPELNDE